jgi:hypothetical protein
LLPSPAMKLLLTSLAVLSLAGCAKTLNNHRSDFSPTEPKGAWTDYYSAIKNGERPEPPKEKK